MPAGLNCKIDIIRLITNDDDVGGAYSTGTIIHQGIDARIDEEPTNTQFLQQGLETVKVFSGIIWGYNLNFREQDEIDVVSPPNHEYYGKRFRVVDKTGSSNHPAQKRNIWNVKLTRSQIAHREFIQ